MKMEISDKQQPSIPSFIDLRVSREEIVCRYAETRSFCQVPKIGWLQGAE